MPIILLIRHGENDYVKTGKFAGRIPGVHLNSKGQQEANDLADALKDAPISAIYSSPLVRAIETARPLAKIKDLKITTMKGLIETDIGDWQGLEVKRARKLPVWKNVQNSPSRFRFPNGESFQEEQTRLVITVEEIIKRHKDDELVTVFSHADPIKLIINYYLGMPLDHFQRLACSTGAVSILMVAQNGPMLLGLNINPPFRFPFHKKNKNKKQGR